jgi:hypothetical protein
MPVYFIQMGEGGPVKIGSTINVEKRLATLQNANPEQLRVIRLVPGELWHERWMQGYFASVLIAREWFKFHPDMLTVEFTNDPYPREVAAVPLQFNSFADLMDAWPSLADLAADIGVPVDLMERIRQRGRVHYAYWAKLCRAARARGIGVIPRAHLSILLHRSEEERIAAYQARRAAIGPRNRWNQ